MYIAPNSTIELFKSLKLDNNYGNTMWFANVGDQNNFFEARYFLKLNAYSYQRKDIGVIRIEAPIGNVYDVNYMRFRNDSFENRWFYAFITRVEYINNVTCNIYYTIDVIQTYMFDWTLEQCLVERQHSITDIAGDNLIPEGLELGDYINDSSNVLYRPTTSDYNYLICVGLTEVEYQAIEDAGWTVGSSYFESVAGVMSLTAFLLVDTSASSSDLKDIMDYLNNNNKIDSIVSITLVPKNFTLSGTYYNDFVNIFKPTTIDGYTPINQKLLTYPYCYMDVFNDQNEHEELRYELSTDVNGMRFKICGIMSPNPEVLLIPQNYDKTSNSPEKTLSLGGLPQIPYFNDSYKAWRALNYDQMAVSRQITAQQVGFQKEELAVARNQNAMNAAAGTAQNAISAFKQVAKGDILGAVGSGVGGVQSLANGAFELQKNRISERASDYENYALKLRQSADESRARNLPNSPHVGTTSGSFSISQKGFWYNKKSIREQYAERIDKYFTMFGYAQNKVGIPNIHVRQYFTYIKTSGSCVSGSIPQDDRDIIDTIFDRGIRFWTNYNYFEDYTVNNTII